MPMDESHEPVEPKAPVAAPAVTNQDVSTASASVRALLQALPAKRQCPQGAGVDRPVAVSPAGEDAASTPLDLGDVLAKYREANRNVSAKLVHSSIVKYHNETWSSDPVTARQRLEETAAQMYFAGRAVSTLENRQSAVRGYEFFCQELRLRAYPAEEATVGLFSAWTAARIDPASVTKYIGHVRAHHHELGYQFSQNKDLPRVMQIIDGAKRLEELAGNTDKRIKLGMTPGVLEDVHDARAKNTAPPASIYSMDNNVMAKAVRNTNFCAAARGSEIAVKLKRHGMTRALRIKHLIWHDQPSKGRPYVVILFPRRKNDQLGVIEGISNVVMGVTLHRSVCAYTSLKEWLQQRRDSGEVLTDESLLFPVLSKEGELEPLSFDVMDRSLAVDLTLTGYPADKYKSHSYRHGWATTMWRNGMSDTWINALGGWSRSAKSHLAYIGTEMAIDEQERAKMAVYLTHPFVQPNAFSSGSGHGRPESGLSPSHQPMVEYAPSVLESGFVLNLGSNTSKPG